MTAKKPAAGSKGKTTPKSPAPKQAKATPKPPAPKKKKAAKATPKKTAPKKRAAKATPKPAASKKKAAKATPKKKTAKATPKPAASKPAASKPAAPKKAAPKKAAPKKAPTSSAPEHKAPEKPTAGDYGPVIARIEAKAAAAGVTLAEGASAKAIAATEKVLGAKLPGDVVAFYRRHDGSDDQPAVDGRELLSLARIVSEWKIWKDLFDQGTFEENDHGMPGPGVQKKWWIPEWVPVTYDGAGNHHVIDLAPAPGGTYGQVLSFWHDDDSRTVVAESFLEWLDGATWGDGEA
jgi:cell wall assembly regulator SMI1